MQCVQTPLPQGSAEILIIKSYEGEISMEWLVNKGKLKS